MFSSTAGLAWAEKWRSCNLSSTRHEQLAVGKCAEMQRRSALTFASGRAPIRSLHATRLSDHATPPTRFFCELEAPNTVAVRGRIGRQSAFLKKVVRPSLQFRSFLAALTYNTDRETSWRACSSYQVPQPTLWPSAWFRRLYASVLTPYWCEASPPRAGIALPGDRGPD